MQALITAGWTIIQQQVLLITGKRHVWIDMEAQKSAEKIYIEVKGFETNYSLIEYFSNTVGQCILYQTAIEYLKLNVPLYLAVPKHAYDGILDEPLPRATLKKIGLKLIVFDPEVEVILQWQP